MNLISKCAVCGAVACGVVGHLVHVVAYPEGVNVVGIERPFSNHPETPERGDYIREPQVSVVSTGYALPPGRGIGYFQQFPEQPPPIQPAQRRLAWLLDAPTDVSSGELKST